MISSALSTLHSSINFMAYSRRPMSMFNPRLKQDGVAYLFPVHLSNKPNRIKFCKIQMALLNERLSHGIELLKSPDILAYDLIQGPLIKWNFVLEKTVADTPTAVLLHGIMGSRKNWGNFTRRLAQHFPLWQFLLVDLRCHGDSAKLNKRVPHTVASAALDILKLVAQLKITPRVLIGHSFGGKVALSMVEQAAKPLARPVQVWVLDATPGKVQAGGNGDHPMELISSLKRMPEKISSKRYVIDALVGEGFSRDVAVWVATNLQQNKLANEARCNFSWVFDLNGICDMYHSYEETNLWHVVEDVPLGVHINFLKAERSLHRWTLEDLRRICASEGGGVEMHVLEDAGHWVHADNPDGLFRILSPTFLGARV